MKRRTFVGIVGTSAVAASSGCLSGTTSSADRTSTTEPATRRETARLTAVVSDVSYAGTASADQSVTGSFDCEAATATLDGRLSTSSCRTVAIRALSDDRKAGSAQLVVYPKWDEPRPPAEIDCAGATYEYRIRLEATDQLPGTVEVVHERPDGDDPLRFSLASDC